MVEVLPLVAFILSIVAFILDIALSFAPNYWWYMKVTASSNLGTTTSETFLGLWNYCAKYMFRGSTVAEDEICYSHTDDEFPADKIFLGATQVFQCVGVLLLVATIVFHSLKLFAMKDKSFLTALVCAHAIWAALCLIGSAGTFGHGIRVLNTDKLDFRDDLHFGLGFAVVSGVISLVAGILLFVSMFKHGGVEPKA